MKPIVFIFGNSEFKPYKLKFLCFAFLLLVLDLANALLESWINHLNILFLLFLQLLYCYYTTDQKKTFGLAL